MTTTALDRHRSEGRDLVTPLRPEEALQKAFQDAVESTVSASLLFSVQLLVRGGASVNQAMRLATFMHVDDLGPATGRSLGLSASTVSRWRAEIREFTAAAGGVDSMGDDVHHVARLLAGDDGQAADQHGEAV